MSAIPLDVTEGIVALRAAASGTPPWWDQLCPRCDLPLAAHDDWSPCEQG